MSRKVLGLWNSQEFKRTAAARIESRIRATSKKVAQAVQKGPDKLGGHFGVGSA